MYIYIYIYMAGPLVVPRGLVDPVADQRHDQPYIR